MGNEFFCRISDSRGLICVVGFGSLVSFLISGCSYSFLLGSCGLADSELPFIGLAFILGTVLSSFCFKAVGPDVVDRVVSSILPIALFGLGVVGVSLCSVTNLGPWPIGVLTFVIGYLFMVLGVKWFRFLGDYCRGKGATGCVAVLNISSIVCMLFSLVAMVGAMQFGLLGASIVSLMQVAIIWWCDKVLTTLGMGGPAENDSVHRLSHTSSVTLAGYGVTFGVATYISIGSDARDVGVGVASLVIAIAISALILVFLKSIKKDFDLPFGLTVRFSAVAGCCMVACLPVLSGIAHISPACLSIAISLLQCMSMTLFALQVCWETGEDVGQILLSNMTVYATGAGAAFVLSWIIQTLLSDHVALDACCFISVAATLIVLTFLPSMRSGAAVINLDVFPENEGHGAKAVRLGETLAARCGLTPRETEILMLILKGKSRQQMADELGLSVWTVRDYAATVYAKTGVHSAKELVALVTMG